MRRGASSRSVTSGIGRAANATKSSTAGAARPPVAQARLHLRARLRVLPGMIELKKKDRDEDIDLHPKEPEAIRAVLAVADTKPEEFRGPGYAELNEPFDPEEWREA